MLAAAFLVLLAATARALVVTSNLRARSFHCALVVVVATSTAVTVIVVMVLVRFVRLFLGLRHRVGFRRERGEFLIARDYGDPESSLSDDGKCLRNPGGSACRLNAEDP